MGKNYRLQVCMVNESVTASAKLRQVDDAFNSNSALVFLADSSPKEPSKSMAHSPLVLPAGSSGLMSRLVLNSFRAGRRFVETGFNERRKVIAVTSLLHLLNGNEAKRSG